VTFEVLRPRIRDNLLPNAIWLLYPLRIPLESGRRSSLADENSERAFP
jgi:hypothetical protein